MPTTGQREKATPEEQERAKLRRQMDEIIGAKGTLAEDKKARLKTWFSEVPEAQRTVILEKLVETRISAIDAREALVSQERKPLFEDADFNRDKIKAEKAKDIDEVPSKLDGPDGVWSNLEQACIKFLSSHGRGGDVIVVPNVTMTGTASTQNEAITLFNAENRQNVLKSFVNMLSGEEPQVNFVKLRSRIETGHPICIKLSLAEQGVDSLKLVGNLFHECGHASTGDAAETDKVFHQELSDVFAYLESSREQMDAYWAKVRDYMEYAKWVPADGQVDNLMQVMLTPDKLEKWNAKIRG
jgi:hypothetical protein